MMQVIAPVADVLGATGRERQVLLGTEITVQSTQSDRSVVTTAHCYAGDMLTAKIGEAAAPTHMVGTLATHAYRAEDMKSGDLMHLPFGARVTVMDERQKFFETNVGYVPKKHLRPLDRPFADPATIAQMHFGVPYLWGGDSTLGIDCSGLVAAALRACAITCPDDSGPQKDQLGHDATGDYQRGDLVFWKGHVGMMVDGDTMIHANAHHMATVYEPIENAILRIKAQGDGEVTAHKRL